MINDLFISNGNLRLTLAGKLLLTFMAKNSSELQISMIDNFSPFVNHFNIFTNERMLSHPSKYGLII